jgi:hypothetical protein
VAAVKWFAAALDTPVEPAAGDTTTAIALKLERQASAEIASDAA